MIPLYENNRGYRQGRKQCSNYGICSFQIGLFCPPGANCYNSSISCTNDAELFHQNHRFQDLVTFQKRKARAGISGRGGGFSRLLNCSFQLFVHHDVLLFTSIIRITSIIHFLNKLIHLQYFKYFLRLGLMY